MAYTNPLPLSLKQMGEVDPMNPLMEQYIEVAKGIFNWEGLPKDVPYGYLERLLFRHGSVGIKKVKGFGLVLCAASPALKDIYGRPITWVPMFPEGVNTPGNKIFEEDLFRESDLPTLTLDSSYLQRMYPFLSAKAEALQTLSANLNVIQQPVAIFGNVGNESQGIMMKKDLEAKKRYIPVIKDTGQAQVLDLGAKDYTQNLVAVIRAMDSECLTVLGVQNRGMEKASGVNIAESSTLNQQLNTFITQGLKIREQWVEKINKKLGTELKVTLQDAYYQYLERDTQEVKEEVETVADDTAGN